MTSEPSLELPLDSTESEVLEGMAVQPTDGGAPTLTRDFVTFACKILINASIEFVMLPLASLAFAADMITRRSGKRARLYQVMRLGRRWDAWLRVFRPASQLKTEPGPLPKSAVIGADNLVASVEHLIRSGDLPSRYRSQVEQWGRMIRSPGEPLEDDARDSAEPHDG